MANPQPIDCYDLTLLNDNQLFDYFSENARYDDTSPNMPYSIRFGSQSIFSGDTAELFQKFKAKVRSYVPPVLTHMVHGGFDEKAKKYLIKCTSCKAILPNWECRDDPCPERNKRWMPKKKTRKTARTS